ncbi:MAG: right-handed parallel beta-helix repeat-containing protein [bacterium]|nr:right-handed parallel beta-helix repeat-containing protein [bacterium]
MRLTSGETAQAVLSGLTLTGGSGETTSTHRGTGPASGGIFCVGASPTIIESNIVTGFSMAGAGIYAWSTDLVIRDSIIRSNEAPWQDGGGVAAHASSSLEMYDTLVSSNLYLGHGGGVSLGASSGTLERCTIQFSFSGPDSYPGAGVWSNGALRSCASMPIP